MILKNEISKMLFLLSVTVLAQSTFPETGKMSNTTIYGFSQGGTNDSADSQIIKSHPDINIRAWSQWGTSGTQSDHFNKTAIATYKQNNILLVGGLTATVYFYSQANDSNDFKDMITRDADNALVPHSYIVPDAYRGNLANPKFRQYVINVAKAQIDAGVDGIFFDEVNAGLSGNKFDGNEGFDDYHLKDFNRFLAAKHPDFTFQNWCTTYKMDSSNVLDPGKPLDDLEHNFNYRTYLKKNGWNTSPFTTANPLAKVWGKTTGNRPEINRSTFIQQYTIDIYWKEIVAAVRDYARQTYGKEILITSNGIFPFVDFNSVGLYNYNVDNNGSEAQYVPATNAHLDGKVSLSNVFRTLYHRNESIAGNVPCVLFIDWPTTMMNNYYGFSPSEKMDYWRIYAAEAYAHGLFFSFHFKTSISNDPTAAESGVLDSLVNYTAFYKSHKDLFENCSLTDTTVVVTNENITTSLIFQPGHNRFLLHAINHNYQSGIKPQYNVSVTVPLGIELKRILAFSPDGTSTVELPVQYKDNSISCTIDTLYYYTILSLEYGDVAVLKKSTSKIKGGFSDNHKAHLMVNLQGKHIRSTDADVSRSNSSFSSGVYVGGTQKKRSVVNR
jgi:hypothetical protein